MSDQQNHLPSSPRQSFASSVIPRLSFNTDFRHLKQGTLFLRILRPTIVLLQIFGIFPAHKSILHWKNIWSYLVTAFMLFGFSYILTYRTYIATVEMFKKWDADTVLQFAVCLWFYIAINCLIFTFRLGWGCKLEIINRMLR